MRFHSHVDGIATHTHTKIQKKHKDEEIRLMVISGEGAWRMGKMSEGGQRTVMDGN